ncbi:MAG: hypothetical protein SNH35_04815 [Rikenellaceae bacterium]
MKKITSILLTLSFCLSVYGQTEQGVEQVKSSFDLGSHAVSSNQIDRKKDDFEIYFRQDVYAIEPNVKDNKQVLERLAETLDQIMADSLSPIGKIEIESWTSPEPGESYNNKLSRRRSNALREYILV